MLKSLSSLYLSLYPSEVHNIVCVQKRGRENLLLPQTKPNLVIYIELLQSQIYSTLYTD